MKNSKERSQHLFPRNELLYCDSRSTGCLVGETGNTSEDSKDFSLALSFSYAHVRPDEDPFREGQRSWLCHTDPLWFLGTIRTHWGPPCPRKPSLTPTCLSSEVYWFPRTPAPSLCVAQMHRTMQKRSMPELCLKSLSASGASKMTVTVLNIMLHFLQLRRACTKGWILSKEGNEVSFLHSEGLSISWEVEWLCRFWDPGSWNVTPPRQPCSPTSQDHGHPECLNEMGGYVHALVS